MSDQTSEPAASSQELAADVTTDEQARVEHAAEVAGESGPLQSRASQRGARRRCCATSAWSSC